MRDVYVYMLEYENNDKIYIGSTVHPQIRYYQQMKCGTQIGDHNQKIKMIVLDRCQMSDRYEWERFYMDLFKSWGFILKNKHRIINTKRKNRYENKRQ